VIQGDGVNFDSIGEILEGLKADGFSAENVAFGMGAELLQKVNRDTQRMAMKASAARINGTWHDVLKTPKTDASKASKPGVLSLVANGSGLKTVRRAALNGATDLLEPVFRNGKILREQTLDDIRERAKLA
jgi:nicotinamide phosphoribosyltransferase